MRVVAFWRAAEGREEAVRRILRELAAAADRESGCLGFEVLESAGRPGSFVLDEHYADARAHAEHLASAHFNVLVLQRAVPLLAHRDVQIYRALAPDPTAGAQPTPQAPPTEGREVRRHDQPQGCRDHR